MDNHALLKKVFRGKKKVFTIETQSKWISRKGIGT